MALVWGRVGSWGGGGGSGLSSCVVTSLGLHCCEWAARWVSFRGVVGDRVGWCGSQRGSRSQRRYPPAAWPGWATRSFIDPMSLSLGRCGITAPPGAQRRGDGQGPVGPSFYLINP